MTNDIFVQLGHGCVSVHKGKVGMSENEFAIIHELKCELYAMGLVLGYVIFIYISTHNFQCIVYFEKAGFRIRGKLSGSGIKYSLEVTHFQISQINIHEMLISYKISRVYLYYFDY